MKKEIRKVPRDPDGKPFHVYRERKGLLVYWCKFATQLEADNCGQKIKRLKDPHTGGWYYQGDETIAAVRQRPRAETKREVNEILDALRVRARQEKYGLTVAAPAAVTLSELVAARLADPGRQAMPSYAAAKRELEAFMDFFPADPDVTALTTADMKDYVTRRCAEVGPGTINRKLGYVSSMLHAAGDYFAALESWRPPRIPYADEPEGRERTLTLDEATRIVVWLLTAPARRRTDLIARQKVADIFRLALLTSTRQGEWRKRKWAQVDLETGVIKLTKTKTGKSRTLVMTPPVRAILERRFGARGASEYIFPGERKAHQPMRENSIRHLLQQAAEALKIPYGRKVEGGFVFHDLRHTAVSAMLLASHDLATVAQVAGHKKEGMTLRYSHATAASIGRALGSLEQFAILVEIPDEVDRKLTEVNKAAD